MKSLSICCAMALGAAMAVAAPVAWAGPAAQAASASTAAPASPQLHAAMRSLWHGHIVTTRDYALAVHAGDQAAAAKAADAVVANAKQIANAVAGFYGKDAGAGLLKLLGGHWAGVKALTDTTKAGNNAGEQKAMQELAGNATALAKFLAGANPNWTEGALQGALMMHVNDHKTQIDEMMSNAPEAEQAKSWSGMQHHMDMIADALSDGIAKQFPNKVK
ncbi:MAG TPA: hypothetical protein VFX04_02780 [Rhodanobacteraceae bacterium]|jgi:hypothetical protein|nr:hypothetical protein [Rhodanobacteraceae bacterium]